MCGENKIPLGTYFEEHEGEVLFFDLDLAYSAWHKYHSIEFQSKHTRCFQGSMILSVACTCVCVYAYTMGSKPFQLSIVRLLRKPQMDQIILVNLWISLINFSQNEKKVFYRTPTLLEEYNFHVVIIWKIWPHKGKKKGDVPHHAHVESFLKK